MGLKKKTIRLVEKILNDDSKRKLYTEAEILYMQKGLDLMIAERERRKKERKHNKGFGYETESESNRGKTE